MTDRFTPDAVIRGHIKGLMSTTGDGKRHLDKVALGVLVGVPTVAAVAVVVFGLNLGDPGFLIAAGALLTAGQLGMFAQLAAWRDRLTTRMDQYSWVEAPVRTNIDTAAAHVSMSTYLGVFFTIAVVAGNNSVNSMGQIVGWAAVLAAFFGTYLMMLLLIIVPTLYEAYLEVNRVDPSVSGSSQVF